MASSNHSSKDERGDHADSDADLAQISEALAQLTKGEKTAQALESHLTSLEKKIDDLLASFEESERAKVDEVNSKVSGSRFGSGDEGSGENA
ncbi:hypothetical protein BDZ45DRAFT_670336 [Acephala macrosclerotiorum]|nr:hypothetical protein BDZ45DRAFT_670336 [Acephala macrosclerotiorum]